MIKIKNLHKSFGDRVILNNLNFSIKNGECVAIIGKSGIGKSVLLKHIIGLMKPDNGEIHINDKIVNALSFKELQKIRNKISMVFQFGALFDFLNVIENVSLPLKKLTNYSKVEIDKYAKESLIDVGLEGAEYMMPSELSGGMKKRVGIARAIVNDSNYLFCDEPNSGLDPLTAIKIDDLILELTQKLNTTTIVVTHDMNSVIEIGEYIMFLHNGKKLWEGDNKQILKTKIKDLNDFIFSNKLMKKIR